MRDFEAREHLIKAALYAATDFIAENPTDPHADAQAELHEEMLDEAATRYVHILFESGKITLADYIPLEVEQSIRNQVIGYLRGKAATRRDEIPNVDDPLDRDGLRAQVIPLEKAASVLRAEEK